MVPKLLVKLAQPFVQLNFINQQQAQLAIDHLLLLQLWPQQRTKVEFILTSESIDLNTHLKHIDELRQLLSNFISEPAIIENRINEIMSYFMPSNEAIQAWNKTDQYARLLVLSQYAYYIKTDQNAKNLIYQTSSKYGELTISINLAKPEKTQAQIIAEKNAVSNNPDEPKCGICIENINFHGTLTKPSRENLRVIYEDLNQHPWFFQYSPYAYLNGHFVINDLVHQPMQINDDTIVKLLSFVDAHPEFMLGSNADLPIVGGSLLGHNHFQGALERLPITQAKTLLKCKTHNAVVELLDWPLNTVKISTSNKIDCINLVNKTIHFWRTYQTDGIINDHNQTVTLITEKLEQTYISYIILRNNATNDLYPQGIYHVHAEKFHIKQENIGLMEAAGLAILPGRLIHEFNKILILYQQFDQIAFIEQIKHDHDVKKHADWIVSILNQNVDLTMDVLLKATGDVFVNGLEDCQILNNHQFIHWFKAFLFHHPISIDNGNGLVIECFNVGNIIKQIYLNKVPLLLEYKNPYQYLDNHILLNAFVGPACGRIQDGKIFNQHFNIQLPVDQKHNYMHGMQHKWSDLIYDINVDYESEQITVDFQTHQFNQDLNTTYQINNRLLINKTIPSCIFKYDVNSTSKTLINPSHHFYWNLNSHDLCNDKLQLNMQAIWKLNEFNNPMELKRIKLTEALILKEWMHTLNAITNQNQHVIDHPFVLTEKLIALSNGKVQLTMIPSINELVIYTYFSQTPNLFKYKNQGICFESQYVPTSLANMNTNEVINHHYQNSVEYIFKDLVLSK